MQQKSALLIVDDERYVLNSLKRLFVDDSVTVLTAENATEGLSLLKRNRVDVVISDQRMPGESGIDFLTKVREDYPETILIMLTGHAELDVAMKAINEAEIYHLMTKPWDPQELRGLIMKALQRVELARKQGGSMERIGGQQKKLEQLEHEYPGIAQVEKDEQGIIILVEPDDESSGM